MRGGHKMAWDWFGLKAVFNKKEIAKENKSEPLSEKEIATMKKLPYIKVLDTQVDRKNPSNGFFELDWNEYFVDDLKKAGYTGSTDEEIVDKWFKALCQSVATEDQLQQEVRVV
jgi:hypothetical protein